MGGHGFDGAKQLPDISDQVAVRVREVTSGATVTTYVGRAKPGAVETDEDWAVQRIVETDLGGGVITTEITWAEKSFNGNPPTPTARFVHQADDMPSLTYG